MKMFFASLMAVCALAFAAHAEEVEMTIKVTNGTSERMLYATNENATMIECVMQGPMIAMQVVEKNLGAGWAILSFSCGPPRREI